MSKKVEVKKQFKRLFWDLETSYNIVSTWNVGHDISINHDNILKERAIICVCWKWEGEREVYSLEWNKGDDKQLLIDFIKIINEADESIGHNGDKFDIKWLRTRCLFHRIEAFPEYHSIDTLKLAKSGFRFNSNRLDYIGKFLGFGGKLPTDFSLWQRIVEKNDPIAMNTMVKYCMKDVILLEKIYYAMNPYTKARFHVGVQMGNGQCSCANCGSMNSTLSKTRVTALGVLRRQMYCEDCHKYWTISNEAFLKK